MVTSQRPTGESDYASLSQGELESVKGLITLKGSLKSLPFPKVKSFLLGLERLRDLIFSYSLVKKKKSYSLLFCFLTRASQGLL